MVGSRVQVVFAASLARTMSYLYEALFAALLPIFAWLFSFETVGAASNSPFGMLMTMPLPAKVHGAVTFHSMVTGFPCATVMGSGLTAMPPPQPAPETVICTLQLSGVQFG